jgi:hypothetical protein
MFWRSLRTVYLPRNVTHPKAERKSESSRRLSTCPLQLPGGLDHPVQMSGGIFDVKVLVLSCPALGGEQSAPMHFLEVTEGKFVSLLGLFFLGIIDAQMPPSVRFESVRLDKFILVLGGRPMFAPCVPLVEHELTFVDKLFPVSKSGSIEFDRHSYTSAF